MTLQEKAFTWTFFSQKCSTCFYRNYCIRASGFNYDRRKYLLTIKGHKQKMTEGMKHGIELHKKVQADLPTLEDLGKREFLKRLEEGFVEVKEAACCNPSVGLRGHIDILTIRRRNNEYFITIREIKAGFKPSYLLQASAYTMILSSPDALMHISYRESFPLYQLDDNPIINIDVEFVIESKGKVKSTAVPFVRRNKALSKAHEYMMAIMRRAKNFRKLHRPYKVYDLVLETLPYCKDRGKVCSPSEPIMNCSFRRICFEEHPFHTTRQLFLGKRKLLVKTRPR